MPISGLYPPLLMATSLVGVIALGLGGRTTERSWAWAARALALLALVAGVYLLAMRSGAWANELVRWDGPAHAWGILFFVGAIPLVGTMAVESEIPVALALGAVLGMTILGSANHLFVLFLGLEIMSLSTYLLIVGLRRDKRSIEAALKYFFSGAIAAGLYLFGLSIFYAATGSMQLALPADAPAMVQLGILLMLCAALFKVGAFPMQFWLPDAYDAAEPELAGFMSTAVKAAGFLLMLRLAALVVPGSRNVFELALPAIAIATMTFGNLLALRQDRVQRLLAYSSLSHVGYILAGVWAWLKLGPTHEAAAAIYFYLAVYLFMNTGAFLFLAATGVREVRELNGWGKRAPGLAGFFVLMILSLAAIPPTGGFLAKFYILWDVVRAGGYGLAVAIALNSVVGIAYYFRLIKAVVLEEGAGEEGCPCVGLVTRVSLWCCAAGVLALGLNPGLRAILMSWLNG